MQRHAPSELGLLAVFLVTAVGFALLTLDFRSSSAALFPRLTAGVIVVGVALLLARDYLPGPVRRVVAEPVSLVEREETAVDPTAEREREDDVDIEGHTGADAPGSAADERPLTPRQFTFVAIAGYVGLSFLLSVLVATPVFVLAYAAWFGHRWTTALVLTAVSVLVVVSFVHLANAPLGDGFLLPGGGL